MFGEIEGLRPAPIELLLSIAFDTRKSIHAFIAHQKTSLLGKKGWSNI